MPNCNNKKSSIMRKMSASYADADSGRWHAWFNNSSNKVKPFSFHQKWYYRMLPNTPQGCRQMNVVCTTPAGSTVSNMVTYFFFNSPHMYRTILFSQFNGSGAPKVGKNVTALVSCFKGSWRTSYMGSYIYLNSVKCYAS
ncbi:hypothetical protein ANCCAN_02708 [Ancylostoma caninum]|uniref:Uncharacterized protein n=1 Tax=Ancylostoma caninum TaxID=29170 RepID=A0A368H3G2_ANCCA|nr:hypothetical protein ANCCAN_02708 [Ancylostoma caninum]